MSSGGEFTEQQSLPDQMPGLPTDGPRTQQLLWRRAIVQYKYADGTYDTAHHFTPFQNEVAAVLYFN